MNGQLTLRIPFIGTNQLTNRSPSWQDGRSRQEIPRNLWKPKFLMCFCKDPSFASCLSHSKSVHTSHYISSASILMSSPHLHLCLPSCLFSRFFIIKILYLLRSSGVNKKYKIQILSWKRAPRIGCPLVLSN